MEIISQGILELPDNVTIPDMAPGFINHVWTYSDILSTFSMQFIDQLLRLSFLFLILELTCLWFIRGWALPSWTQFSAMDKQQKKCKIFSAVVMVCFIPAMFLPVTIILFKSGLVI